MRRIPLTLVIVTLVSVTAFAQATGVAPAANDAAASREVLELTLKVQNLETQLREARINGAQCDASAADIRARLNGLVLTQEGQRLKTRREALAAAAKQAGLLVVDVLGQDGQPTGLVEFKPVEKAPAGESK